MSEHKITDKNEILDILQDRLCQLEQAVLSSKHRMRLEEVSFESSMKNRPESLESAPYDAIMRSLADGTVLQNVYDQMAEVMQTDAYKGLSNPGRKLAHLAANVDSPVPMVSSVGDPTVIDIQTIADLTVWEGCTCALAVDWSDHSEMNLEIETEPSPSGPIELQRNEGYWLLKYTPDKNDCFPFQVKLKATAKDESISNSFDITPLRKLPPEQWVIASDKQVAPSPVDVNKPEVYSQTVQHTYQSCKTFSFNNERPTDKAPLKLRKVTIIAKELNWSKDDAYKLYDTYNDNDDIEAIEMFAEKVTIRELLCFYQTNVTINARELCFEGNAARIKTTPKELTKTPQAGVSGSDGLKAGDITLNIVSFISDKPNAIRFDMTGGAGQNGGAGQGGTDGTYIPFFNLPAKVWWQTDVYGTMKVPDGYYAIYWELYNRNCFGARIKDTIKGTKDQWPTDGTDAKPNGKPGEGGDGGVLTSNVYVQKNAVFGGGSSGIVDRDPGGSVYYGGNPGIPIKSIKCLWEYLGGITWATVIGKREAKAGESIKISRAIKQNGDVHQPKISGNPYKWMNTSLFHKFTSQIKNDYLDNRLDEARQGIQCYGGFIEEVMASSFWASFTSQEQNGLKTCLEEMQLISHRSGTNLDYFGHPAGWTPLLSFEVTLSMFKTEIERSASIFYCSYSIKKRQATAQSRFDAAKKFRTQLLLDIDSAKEDYGNALERIIELKVSSLSLSATIKQLQTDLKIKEEDLIRKAEEQLKDPLWLTLGKIGLKTTGTILNMLPVGQPATGLVGNGLTLVSNIDPNKSWDSIIGATDITTKFISSLYEETGDEISQIYKKVPKGKEKELEKLTEAKQAFGDAKKACSALSDGLKDVQNYFESQSISEDELKTVLVGLKEQSEEYGDLLKKAEELIEDKRDFADKLSDAMQELNRSINVINQNILACDALSLELADLQDGPGEECKTRLCSERDRYDALLPHRQTGPKRSTRRSGRNIAHLLSECHRPSFHRRPTPAYGLVL